MPKNVVECAKRRRIQFAVQLAAVARRVVVGLMLVVGQMCYRSFSKAVEAWNHLEEVIINSLPPDRDEALIGEGLTYLQKKTYGKNTEKRKVNFNNSKTFQSNYSLDLVLFILRVYWNT